MKKKPTSTQQIHPSSQMFYILQEQEETFTSKKRLESSLRPVSHVWHTLESEGKGLNRFFIVLFNQHSNHQFHLNDNDEEWEVTYFLIFSFFSFRWLWYFTCGLFVCCSIRKNGKQNKQVAMETIALNIKRMCGTKEKKMFTPDKWINFLLNSFLCFLTLSLNQMILSSCSSSQEILAKNKFDHKF